MSVPACVRSGVLAGSHCLYTKPPVIETGNQMGNGEAWLAAMQKAQQSFAHGKLDHAERELRHAVRISTTRWEGWVNLGVVLLARGSNQEAVNALQRAQTLSPETAVIRLNLADAYCATGQDAEALASCRRAVSMEPTPDALNKLGALLRSSWQLADAESMLVRAIALDPDHQNAQVNLATVLMLTGRLAEAKSALQAALAKSLQGDARTEAVRAYRLLIEWERLDPVMRASFPNRKFDDLIDALNATPEDLMAPDPSMTRFLEELTRVTEQVQVTPVRTWPLPEDWPDIEAHFGLHGGDTVESYLSGLAHREMAPPPPLRAESDLYANAVRLRQNGSISRLLSRHPEAAMRYVHWLILQGLDDAKYCPGHFKMLPNRVRGNTTELRVSPLQVAGTIRHFFLDQFPRAAAAAAEAQALLIYMMVLKTHCFNDGNGRVARFLVNHVLESKGFSPILIPGFMQKAWFSAHREIYRSRDMHPLIEQYQHAQSFTENFLSELAAVRSVSGHAANIRQEASADGIR